MGPSISNRRGEKVQKFCFFNCENLRASGLAWPGLADDVIICGQPPELKSLIFHLEVFRFWAHLLDASALVSEKLVEVLN